MAEHDFVKQYYMMDPAVEDLLPSGDMLEEGMVVIVEDETFRATEYAISIGSEQYLHTALQYNRWCTVSQIATVGDRIWFTGTFEDGTKRRFSHSINDAWIVKKDSIPEHPDAETEYELRPKRNQSKLTEALEAVSETIRKTLRKVVPISDVAEDETFHKIEDLTEEAYGEISRIVDEFVQPIVYQVLTVNPEQVERVKNVLADMLAIENSYNARSKMIETATQRIKAIVEGMEIPEESLREFVNLNFEQSRAVNPKFPNPFAEGIFKHVVYQDGVKSPHPIVEVPILTKCSNPTLIKDVWRRSDKTVKQISEELGVEESVVVGAIKAIEHFEKKIRENFLGGASAEIIANETGLSEKLVADIVNMFATKPKLDSALEEVEENE